MVKCCVIHTARGVAWISNVRWMGAPVPFAVWGYAMPTTDVFDAKPSLRMVSGDPSVITKAEKGAGTIHPSGYRILHDTDGFYKEHRRVVEQALGRKLSPNEHVHHLNHVKLDNRAENLMVVSPAEHTRIHKRLPENTDSTKWCPQCREALPHTAFDRNRARHDGLGVYCRACRRTLKI
jgi:hypothetical protein